MTTKTPMSDYRNVELDDLPTTNRPTSFNDLKWGEREEEAVFRLKDEFADNPAALDLWKALVTAASDIPNLRVKGTRILEKNTPAVIEKKIEQAQKDYDLKRHYFCRLMNGQETGNVYSFAYSDYLDRENIEWDEDLAKQLTNEED